EGNTGGKGDRANAGLGREGEGGPAPPRSAKAPKQEAGEVGQAVPEPAAKPAAVPQPRQPEPSRAESSAPRGGNGHDTAPAGQGRIFASPLARRMAQQAGIDLSAL